MKKNFLVLALVFAAGVFAGVKFAQPVPAPFVPKGPDAKFVFDVMMDSNTDYGPDSPRENIMRAAVKTFVRLNSLRDAEDLIVAAKENGKNADFLYGSMHALTDGFAKQGRVDDALAFYKRIGRDDLRELAWALIRERKFPEARRVIGVQSQNLDLWVDLVEVSRDKNDLLRAQDACRKDCSWEKLVTLAKISRDERDYDRLRAMADQESGPYYRIKEFTEVAGVTQSAKDVARLRSLAAQIKDPSYHLQALRNVAVLTNDSEDRRIAVDYALNQNQDLCLRGGCR